MNMMNVNVDVDVIENVNVDVNEVNEVSSEKKRKSKKLTSEEKERRKEERKRNKEILKALEKVKEEKMKVFIESEEEIEKRHAACKYDANVFAFNPVIVVHSSANGIVHSAAHQKRAAQRKVTRAAAESAQSPVAA